MNWKTLEKEMGALVKKIDCQPDIIVGLVRGGIVPARILSSSLGVKRMYCLTVEKQKEKRKITTEIVGDIDGKTVLLVEDMLESGRSLIEAKKVLESKGAVIKTACLYTMPATEIEPDYFLKQVSDVLQFPWE